MKNKKTRSAVRVLAGTIALLSLTILTAQITFTQQQYSLGDIPLDPKTYQKYMKVWPEDMIAAELPDSYDARADGIVTPAKNQGSCGSCWAFASVGAMESHVLKAYGGDPEDPSVDLSEHQQTFCNSAMGGCSGGSSSAIRYWESNGPQYEACHPYDLLDRTCWEDECQQLDYRVIGFYTTRNTPTDFKTSLWNDGPSYWRFDVYSDFYTYWNGGGGEVYVHTSGGYEGGHAVLLIGWDDTKAAYLCKNSWGANAGPNGDGTFWIAYGGHAPSLGFQMSNFSLPIECETDADCDDQINCNGTETCVAGACQDGTAVECLDDYLFCNGNEVCDELTVLCDSTGNPCDGGTTCSEELDACIPGTCPNGTCDPGEDCTNCPDDCISGSGGGTCDACFKGVCNNDCHPKKEGPDCSDCAPGYCCGDGVCEVDETLENCAVDCGCSSDADCDDGDDCTTDTCNTAGECTHDWPACGDADGCCGPACTAATDPDCTTCSLRGDACGANSDCCSDRCHRGACK